LFLGALDPGERVGHPLDPARRAYLFVIEGGVRLDGDELLAGDQARIDGVRGLELTATQGTELLLLDLP
jgi:redox-sensitive bicupin YhaK (pirin superfamily)